MQMDPFTAQLHASMMSKLATVGLPLVSIAQLRSQLTHSQATSAIAGASGNGAEHDSNCNGACAPHAGAAAGACASASTSVADSVTDFLQQQDIQAFIAQQVQRQQAAREVGRQRAAREAKQLAAQEIAAQAKQAKRPRAGTDTDTQAAHKGANFAEGYTRPDRVGDGSAAGACAAAICRGTSTAKQQDTPNIAKQLKRAHPIKAAAIAADQVLSGASAPHAASAEAVKARAFTVQPAVARALGSSVCMSESNAAAQALLSPGPALVCHKIYELVRSP